jgi:ubiquinone biosynthesis O-methyltransferase
MLGRALRLATSPLQRRIAAMELVPPLEFPCRIEALPEGCSTIDNSLYNDEQYARSWHSTDRSKELATLDLLNSARIPYFDRVWREQLDLPPARPGTFLEVGCGGGIATSALAGLGYHMTGVDPSAPSLDEARTHARRLQLQGKLVFHEGSAYNLGMFPAASFDGVVMADVLEHLLDLPSAVQQVWRVLKPGGILVFDTINRSYKSYLLTIVLAQETLGMVPPRTHDWRLYIKPHELAFLLQSHGFLVDTSHFRGMMPTLDPRQLLRGPPGGWIAQMHEPRLPPPPLSDFVETASLEVNYMGWAVKSKAAAASQRAAGIGAEAASSAVDADAPPSHAPGELAQGLRNFRRSYHSRRSAV